MSRSRATITKAYVRRYSDNGQITAYVEWSNGSRTEGTVSRRARRRNAPQTFAFGEHMHALFGRAKALGVKATRETW